MDAPEQWPASKNGAQPSKNPPITAFVVLRCEMATIAATSIEELASRPIEALVRALEVRLTAFAVCQIGEGWRLKTGPLDSVLLHFVIGGGGFLEVGETRTPLRRGSIVVVPPGTAKSITGQGAVTNEASAEDSCVLHSAGLLSFRARRSSIDLLIGCASVAVQLGAFDDLFSQLSGPLILDVDNAEHYSASFTLLQQELSDPGLGSLVYAECLMKQIIILLLRQHLEEQGAESPLLARLGDSRLLRAVADVVAQPERAYTVASLAAAAGMSRSGFATRFAERYNQTPMQFVQYVRMHSAARLLRSSEMSIKCLAAAVGYSSRSQFSRTFRSIHGVDPTTFREIADQ